MSLVAPFIRTLFLYSLTIGRGGELAKEASMKLNMEHWGWKGASARNRVARKAAKETD